MDTFYYTCPFCKSKLACNDSLKNKSVPCPACQKTIIPDCSEYNISKNQGGFQKPIFSTVFYVIGYIYIAGGIISVFTAIAYESLLLFLSGTLLSITCAFFSFLAGKLIEYVAETCYNTGRTCANTEKILEVLKQDKQ